MEKDEIVFKKERKAMNFKIFFLGMVGFTIAKCVFAGEPFTCYHEKQVLSLEQWKLLDSGARARKLKILGPHSYACFIKNVKELKNLKWDTSAIRKIQILTIRIFSALHGGGDDCDRMSDQELLKREWDDIEYTNILDIDRDGKVEIVYATGTERLGIQSWYIESRDKNGDLHLCSVDTIRGLKKDLYDINGDGKMELVIRKDVDIDSCSAGPLLNLESICEYKEGKLIISNEKFSAYLLSKYKSKKNAALKNIKEFRTYIEELEKKLKESGDEGIKEEIKENIEDAKEELNEYIKYISVLDKEITKLTRKIRNKK